MNKEVDNGVKKFFIIFLGFIVVLNILSILLFSHSLFYYLSDLVAIHVYNNGWTHESFSTDYNNMLKCSMIARILFLLILVGFGLFMYFVKKKVKNNRKFIYPIMFLLFLLILEFGVLSFFDFALPFLKYGCFGWTVPEDVCVQPYISLFYPFGYQSIFIFCILLIIGYVLDNKNNDEKQIYKIENNNMRKFWIIFSLFTLILIILSTILFGNYSFMYGVIEIFEGTKWSSKEYYRILKFSTFSKFLIPVILPCFLWFIYFIRKKVKNNRKFIYPLMFLLLSFVLEFTYLSCFDWVIKLLNPDGVLNAYTYIPFLDPFSICFRIIFTSLFLVGYISDNANLKNNFKWKNIIIKFVCVYVIVFLMQVIVLFVISLFPGSPVALSFNL